MNENVQKAKVVVESQIDVAQFCGFVESSFGQESGSQNSAMILPSSIVRSDSQTVSWRDISDPRMIFGAVPQSFLPSELNVGREEEHPLCKYDGSRRVLLPEEWAELERFGFKMFDQNNPTKGVIHSSTECFGVPEAGGSTFEIPTCVRQTVDDLQKAFLQALYDLSCFAEEKDFLLLKYAAQPIEVHEGGLDASKSERYRILNEYFSDKLKALSSFWDIASAQDHVLLSMDMFPKVSILQWFAAVYPALFGNCSIKGGCATGGVATRLRVWQDLDRAHSYEPNRCDIAVTLTWEEYHSRIASMPALMIEVQNPDGTATWKRTKKRFGDLRFNSLEELVNAYNGMCTTLWNPTRFKNPKSGIITLESRTSCQQPLGECFLPGLLALGWVANFEAVSSYLLGMMERFGGFETFNTLMNDWYNDSIQNGLDACVNGSNSQALDIIEASLSLAEHGLKMRGYGEERHMSLLWARYHREEPIPAERVLAVWRKDGIQALLEYTKVTPDRVANLLKNYQ